MENYIENQIENYLNYINQNDVYWFETPDGEQFDLQKDGSWVYENIKLSARQLASRAVSQE